MIKSLPPPNDFEEFVSYDVESLFTNVLVRQTNGYIIDQIYDENKLKPIACIQTSALEIIDGQSFYVQ